MSDDYVFISYRSVEEAFAVQIANSLAKIGINIWMDQINGIRAGDDWVMSLQTGVTGASAIVAILSPKYVDSKYCRRELQRADSLNKPIFPLLLEPVPKEAWPLEIQSSQYIDFTNWQDDTLFNESFAALVEKLKSVISPSDSPQQIAQDETFQQVPLRALEDQVDKINAKATNTSSKDIRLRSLKRRIKSLTEDLEAAEKQWDFMIDEVMRNRVQRQIDHLIEQIAELDNALDNLE